MLSRRKFLLAAPAVGASVAVMPAFAQERVALKSGGGGTTHPLTPAIRVAAKAGRTAAALLDYSATFVKKERVDGELIESRMALKLRHNPKSVYLKFIAPSEGREVIYVEGRNGGNMLVHETGLASLMGTISVDPTGSLALRESRRPVTDVGMANMAEKLVRQWVVETELPAPAVKYFPSAKLAGKPCQAIEVTHSRAHRKILAPRVRLFVDTATGLPVRVQKFAVSAGQPQVIEDYSYLDVRTNLGLGDIDFDVANPAYDF